MLRPSLKLLGLLALTFTIALLGLARGTNGDAPRAYAADIELQLVAGGLSSPVGLVHAGDGTGRLFIVEQVGRIKVYSGGSVLGTPFLDVSSLIVSGGEQGLLGLAFAPDYENSGFFFINYTDTNGDTRVMRYQVSANPNVANPASATQVLFVDQPEANHNGGALVFGPDGYLYIGMGDGGGMEDPDENGQDNTTLLGKMLRIDVDPLPYTSPPSNPLVGQPGLDEIWANGMRNPWRFSFDRLTGDMWIGDVGQYTWEEIDFQPAASTGLVNYGWDDMEGAHCFEPLTGCITAGRTLPVIEYSHSSGCSVTGGYRYRGAISMLAGQYIYGDYCSGIIWAATLSGSTWTPGVLFDTGMFLSSFGEDEAGELYVVNHAGQVHKIVATIDGDGDGVPDTTDNCPNDINPGQENADANFIELSPKPYDDLTVARSDSAGNACETDDDNDGLTDTMEASGSSCGGVATNALVADTDGDHAIDGAECVLGTNPNSVGQEPSIGSCGATTDADNDKIIAFREICYYGTDPNNANTDGDARNDGCEVHSINGDLTVNVLDLQQIASESGMYASPGSAIKRNFDVTKNGAIDVIDLQQAASAVAVCP